jgi:peptide/nickel transport system substrate-binding protein
MEHDSNTLDRRKFLELVGGSAAAVGAGAAFGRASRLGRLVLPLGDTAPPFPTNNPAQPLTIAHEQAIPTLDPDQTAADVTRSAIMAIYDSLVDYDETANKLVPRAATSWTVVDNTTLDFHLRSGVQFSNGETLDANAVVFSFNRTMSPATKSLQTSIFSNVKSVVATSKLTVRWLLSQADPLLLQYLVTYPILPPQYTTQTGGGIGTAPIGSGPYKLLQFQTGQGITLERNPRYWGPKPAYRYAAYRTLPSSEAQLASLLSGEVQIAANLDPGQALSIESNPKVKIISKPTLLLALITLDQAGRTDPNGPMTNQRVRRALNQAVDVNAIVKDILHGYATPIAAGANPLQFGFDPSVTPWPYDPQKARQLLDAAGYHNGLKLRMISQNADITDQALTAQAVQRYLGQVGVDVTLDTIGDPDAVGSLVISGKAGPMIQFGNSSGGVFDVGAAYSFIFQCGNPFSYFCNPVFQKLYNKQATMLDPDERKPILSQLQRQMKTDCGALFEWAVNGIWGVSAGVDWPAYGGTDDKLYTATPA